MTSVLGRIKNGKRKKITTLWDSALQLSACSEIKLRYNLIYLTTVQIWIVYTFYTLCLQYQYLMYKGHLDSLLFC